MGDRDFSYIGYTVDSEGGVNYIVYECPKCFATVRATKAPRHIKWHEGLLEGWEDA